MKISAVKVSKLDVEMHQAIKTPIGEISAARNVVVCIETSCGLVGWGETSPMAAITYDSQASAYALGTEMAPLLLGQSPVALESCLALLRRYCSRSSILCAFDMALYDLAAQAAGMPLYSYLGGGARALRTDHTIGNQETVDETVAMALHLVESDFDTIKLKTGRPGTLDLEHLSAVRAAVGPDISLRIDCNQGWDYPQALRLLPALAELGVEYLEQPFPVWDVDSFARLRARGVLPLCADESVFTHTDAMRLLRADAVDYLNIKLVKSGGLNTALKINSVAEAAGVRCMIGCFGESRLGLTAAAHLAMARPNIHFIDLDSALHFSADPVIGGLTYGRGGEISLGSGIGLGASLEPGALTDMFEVSS
ncbi:mandelate racemase/muconate lactonizing enzyme family protein [Pseudidiomarina sp. E22-M8]|uniref:mandelate racemase/muconate lactonizing enzyme family protein n=1 Tax=Pseudidiomarina sp. E22-M8 TaxID=3424768 RepID=UPI00403D0C45